LRSALDGKALHSDMHRRVNIKVNMLLICRDMKRKNWLIEKFQRNSPSDRQPCNSVGYVPTGNPGPAFAIGVREGENLYTGSIMVLEATSGAYRNHFKIVARDWHDWDVSA